MRGYAKYLGISVRAVSMAVKNQLIINGYDPNEKKIIVKIADNEYGFLHLHKENLKPIGVQVGEIKFDLDLTGLIPIPSDVTYAEAGRINEILKGALMIMEYEKKSAELVSKSELQQELNILAGKLKQRIIAAPNRITNQIFTAKSQSEAHRIIDNALQNILEDFTGFKG